MSSVWEEGQVSRLATTISIHVESKTGLLPCLLAYNVKVQRNGLANLSLVSIFSSQFRIEQVSYLDTTVSIHVESKTGLAAYIKKCAQHGKEE